MINIGFKLSKHLVKVLIINKVNIAVSYMVISIHILRNPPVYLVHYYRDTIEIIHY